MLIGIIVGAILGWLGSATLVGGKWRHVKDLEFEVVDEGPGALKGCLIQLVFTFICAGIGFLVGYLLETL